MEYSLNSLLNQIPVGSISKSSNLSMAEEPHHLPKVLVLGPPTCFATLESHYSHKFHFVNPKASGLPLHQFMIAHHHIHEPSSIRTILCSAAYSVTADVLRLVPSLGLVVTTSAGTDHIDLNECRRRGIQIAGAGGLFSDEVADMAVALLIDVMRKISAADRYVRTRNQSGPWDFPLGFKASELGLLDWEVLEWKLPRGSSLLVALSCTTPGIKRQLFRTLSIPVLLSLQLLAMHLWSVVH